jgi:hypothetical protein
MYPGVPQVRQYSTLRKIRSNGEIIALRIPPGPINQVAHPEDGHIVEHQCCQGFIYPFQRSGYSGKQTPESASDETCHEHGRLQYVSRGIGIRQSHPTGSKRPHVQLPLPPDIPQNHAKGDGHTKPGEDQRYCRHNGF